MKILIVMAVSLLSLNVVSFASTINENKPASTKNVARKGAFQKIVINGDIDVVLVENDFVQIDNISEQNNITSFNHYVKKGTLYINRLDYRLAKNPVVLIAVNDLQSLEVNGDGNIITKGVLRSSKLKLQINGESKLNLRNIGEIKIESDCDINLHLEKK